MPARSPRPKGRAGYVRSALAYADLTQEEVGRRLSVSPATLNRWMTDTPPDDEMLVRIAQVCGVPIEFLEHGFDGDGDGNGTDTYRRLRQFSRQIVALTERVDALWQRVETTDAERDQLARDVASVSESLETRLATAAEQVLRQARLLQERSDPPAENGEPTP